MDWELKNPRKFHWIPINIPVNVADTKLESMVPVLSVHSGGVPSYVSEVSRWIRIGGWETE